MWNEKKESISVGKRISSSFKRAQPEVASFVHLEDTSSQVKKSNFAVYEEKTADSIGITGFWPDLYQISTMKL